MIGRKPKPTAIKELEGNPGKRKLNNKEPTGAVKKGDGIGGYGECQERIEKSECGIKLGDKNWVAVRVVKFTAICTAFTYQDKK